MSDQTMPRTIRELLEPIVGAAALREAEARVYDEPYQVPEFLPPVTLYACKAGVCALGVMAAVMATAGAFDPEDLEDSLSVDFPESTDFLNALTHGGWYAYPFERQALGAIEHANDNGDLATPGSLTALLDSNIQEVGRG